MARVLQSMLRGWAPPTGSSTRSRDSGVATGGAGQTTYGARISTEAKPPADTATNASVLAWDTARSCRLDVVREDVVDEDLGQPQLPDLADAGDIGEMLDVSPQRVRTPAATHPGFRPRSLTGRTPGGTASSGRPSGIAI